MNKDIWVIANWKDNKTIAEALSWVEQVGPQLGKRDNVKVAVCPTFVALEEVKKAVVVGNYPLLVGSQDLSAKDAGPFTGEEAAKLLSGLADLAILGHSERRQNFQETDEDVAQKVKRAKDANILPLVCIQGENTPVPQGARLVAYEPIFAIGTGNPDTPENAAKVAKSLRVKWGSLEVLYGGSVTSNNAKAFLQQEDISGVLIGGASLDPQEFVRIVKVAYQI